MTVIVLVGKAKTVFSFIKLIAQKFGSQTISELRRD